MLTEAVVVQKRLICVMSFRNPHSQLDMRGWYLTQQIHGLGSASADIIKWSEFL